MLGDHHGQYPDHTNILNSIFVFFIGMALPAAGVRPGSRPVQVSFNNVSPLVVVIDAVDLHPNAWEHLTDDGHDPLPQPNPLTYKFHARISMDDVKSRLMTTSSICFDPDYLMFLEP